MDDLMNKLQNVLNDEESMETNQRACRNAWGGELSGQNDVAEAPPSAPAPPSNNQAPDFSQILSSLGGCLEIPLRSRETLLRSQTPIHSETLIWAKLLSFPRLWHRQKSLTKMLICFSHYVLC